MPKGQSVVLAVFLKLCSGESETGAEGDGSTPLPQRDAGSIAPDAGVRDAGAGDAQIPAADAAISDAMPDSDANVPAPVLSGPPGLYGDEDCQKLAPGVRAYEPAYSFWADGAYKERFVYLPPGAVIDATDPDAWTYPVGTRLYKTFSIDGVRLETRVIEKIQEGHGAQSWKFQVYAWLSNQRGVQLDDGTGQSDVLGTTHDIPSSANCLSCHSAAGQDAVNAFSAIQLNYRGAPLGLSTLLREGSVRSPLGEQLVQGARIPGDATEQRALGVLHANCGNCHGGARPRASMNLRLSVGQTSVESTAAFLFAVDQPLTNWTGRVNESGAPYSLRIASGIPEESAIVARMNIRGSRDQMPPLATEEVDDEGVAAVSAWIESL
jgi:hypothetical protein